MKANKKILTLGALALLPISILPLAVISCSGQDEKITYFESEGLRIASNGTMMGFVDPTFKHVGKLEIKEKYKDVTIKHIGHRAFENQTEIIGLTLPKTLVSIGYYAFHNITSPVDYPSDHDPKIPVKWDISHLENLEIISSFAFSSYEANEAKVPKLLLDLSGSNKLQKIYEGAFSKRDISSLILPNSIDILGFAAFESNPITSITLPDSITLIGGGAFYENQLTSVTLSNSITTIPGQAFQYNQITSLTIPNSITAIGRNAFSDNQITSLTLSDSLTFIGFGAFFDNKLSSITFPNSVTTIGNNAFWGNQLTSLTIPNSVTTIGNNAFANNSFTASSQIVLPTQFDNDAERVRIGLPPKTPSPNPLETDFIPLIVESRAKEKLK